MTEKEESEKTRGYPEALCPGGLVEIRGWGGEGVKSFGALGVVG